MKKKVVLITPNFYPENFPINNFSYLLSKNYDVDILTNLPSYRLNKFYDKYSFFGPFREKINGINIYRTLTFPRISDKKIFIFIHYLIYFISMFFFCCCYFILNKNKTNYIISYSLSPTFTALFGIIGSKITRAKHFNWVQDIWPESIISSTNTKKNIFYKIIEISQNYLFEKSELIAQSDKMKLFFEKKYKKKIYQINNLPRNVFENQNISENKINDKIIFSYFGNIGKAQKLDYFLDILMKIKNKNFEINIFGSGSEKKKLMKNYFDKRVIWHKYKREEDLFKDYNKTNYFLLPLDSIARQKFILPGKFSSYLFFCRPIIGFSNMDSSLEDCIKKNQLGLFIDIDDKVEINIKMIDELFQKNQDYYDTQFIRAKNFYKDYFSNQAIEKQIEKILL